MLQHEDEVGIWTRHATITDLRREVIEALGAADGIDDVDRFAEPLIEVLADRGAIRWRDGGYDFLLRRWDDGSDNWWADAVEEAIVREVGR
jgi:hypothetical protein